MSVKHGLLGNVKVGANAVAEIQEWSYSEEDASPQAILSMGDTVETPIASGAKRGSGSVQCLIDAADTTGQGALTVGASVVLHLIEGPGGVGDRENTGTVVIRSREKSDPKDGIMTVSFNFEGVLTEATL